MGILFGSDSEYEWLLTIQTSLSYKLNSTALKYCARQNDILTDVVGMMTEQFGVVGDLRVSPEAKRNNQASEGKRSLGDLLLVAVDESLKRVFREEGAKVIFSYVENKCHLSTEEIVEKPEVFSAALKRLLGSGAPFIEKMILENLHSKLELKFEEREGYEFSDYVKDLRNGKFTENIT